MFKNCLKIILRQAQDNTEQGRSIINLKLQIVVVVFGAFLLFAKTTAIRAQTAARSFTISPPSLHFTLNPGQKTERTLKITNNSNEEMEFSTTATNFIVTNKDGTPELLPAGTKTDNQYAASAWTAVLPDTIVIPPKKSATTVLYLNVPADARPGGRYFAVSFKPTGVGTPEGSGAAVNPVIGTLVYLTVAGKVTESSRVIQFSAPPLSEFGPIAITTEIKNMGDLHASPRGTIEIKNLFNKKVSSAALANLNVFPGTSRIYTNTWDKKWLFGRFTANLTGYYGQANNLPLTAMTSFWVIPYRLIIGILLAIAIGLTSYYYFKGKKAKEEEVKE